MPLTGILGAWYESEKLDTTPPTLHVSIEPKTLWAPNGKPVEVTVNIDVEDDYDGQPLVELVSITANEELGDGDIVDAGIGTDDRSFSLSAKRSGKNKDGRIYTITYRATDALGNQSESMTTITVGHDKRNASGS